MIGLTIAAKTKASSSPDPQAQRRVPGGVGTSDYSRSSVACNALGEVSLRGGDIQQLPVLRKLDAALYSTKS